MTNTISNDMTPKLATRSSELCPTAINRVLAEVRQLQQQGKTLVSLMRGQPDLPTPPHIVEAAIKALRDGRTGYPDNRGEPALREAVAEKLARDQNLTYHPATEILVTDGATAGVSMAFAALLQPGDEVLLPSPIYDAYNSPIRLWGGQAVPVPAVVRDGRYVLDRIAVEAACTDRTRVLLLNSPWNPVGTVFDKAELQAIATVVVEKKLWLLSDEIYETLIYDARQHLSPAALSDEMRQRTIVIHSLSKTYAMTGWRVGFCAGPAEVINAMGLIWQQSSRGPATFVQDAAVCALQSDQACVQAMTAEYQRRRDVVVSHLNDCPNVRPFTPEGGLFVMLDIHRLGLSSDEVRRILLEESGVVVVHGSAFGPGGEGTLRISFAGGARLIEGVQRLCEGLRRVC